MSIHAPVRPTLAVVAAGDAQRQPTLQHLELRIGKMTCGHWASAIGKAVAATAGVTAVKVNPATKIAQIDYDPARAKIHDIVQSIRSGGYTVGTATLRIPIKGMHCSSCVVRLELALQMTPGVVSARADLVLSAIDIEYQPESISFEQIRKAIESAGYRVAEPKVEPGSETLDPAEAANEQEYRTLMRKFWFAAAVSIPVMALSYPNLIPGLRDWMPMGSEPEVKVTFADVAGVDEAKQELTEVVGFLKDPHTYGRLGARIPRGVLLVGPPGTGKTLIARAVAGEAGVRFFSITGSEFVEMFVGVGAARVRDLFDQARAQAPAIIFIDELDALGRARGIDFPGTGHDEKEQTLNQLLAEMDGFDPSAGIIVLAATNRPEVLDPALLRAGRFDRQVLVDRPDRKGRADILRVHLGKIRTVPDLDVDAIAGLAPGFTGADLANLVNEAALVATRRGADATALDDFTQAVERLVAGLEKKSRVISPREREVVAHHEMGHAIVAMALPGTDPVQKVSIIPRGIAALGYTMQRPTEDRFLMSRSELANRMAVLLGGRAAESLVFDEVSTGATDDLARATDIARNMAVRFGMTQELGQVAYEPETGSFLVDQTPMWRPRTYGDGTAEVIDHSVKDLIDKAFQTARGILQRNQSILEASASELLKRETLGAEELAKLTAGLAREGSAKSLPVAAE